MSAPGDVDARLGAALRRPVSRAATKEAAGEAEPEATTGPLGEPAGPADAGAGGEPPGRSRDFSALFNEALRRP